jgi:hypothetical protein
MSPVCPFPDLYKATQITTAEGRLRWNEGLQL